MAKNVQVAEATLAWTRREQTYVIQAAIMLLEGPRRHWAAQARGRIQSNSSIILQNIGENPNIGDF